MGDENFSEKGGLNTFSRLVMTLQMIHPGAIAISMSAFLKAELEQMDRLDLEDIRKKKTDLLQEISAIMGSILSAPGFQSSEERASKARKEVEKSFEVVFGKTRRWKFW